MNDPIGIPFGSFSSMRFDLGSKESKENYFTGGFLVLRITMFSTFRLSML